MRRVAIDKIYGGNSIANYNAGNKAHKDVAITLQKCGFELITYKDFGFRNNLCARFVRAISLILLYLRIRNADEILFQFPGFISHWLLLKLKKRGIRFIALIHDVESIRTEKILLQEISVFNQMDIIISHTPAMEQKLRTIGVRTHIINMFLFDYYTKDSNVYPIGDDWKSIVFAGNLAKSPFLSELSNCFCPLKVYLYGKGWSASQFDGQFMYEGFFEPEKVSSIKGGWGLVWDGNSVNTCETTAIGRYLRYNASHKISLYLVAGKPLIVWEQSSLAAYVQEHKLGIVVSSIADAFEQISLMPEESYRVYRNNALAYKQKLESGYFLKRIFRKETD